MLKIERTGQFKRDYRRERKGRGSILETNFTTVLQWLVSNQPLPKKYCDHALIGNWKDHRECHIKPDLILIYRKPNDSILQLVRMGSHSTLDL